MKKLLCLFLSVILLCLLCGCSGNIADNGSEDDNIFKQEVTIVKLPSPPKCKTSDDNAVVNKVIEILGLIEKSPIESENINGGWEIMVKLNIDGKELNYTIGGVFTDADGKQYKVENLGEIKEKINKIYQELDAPEVDYP